MKTKHTKGIWEKKKETISPQHAATLYLGDGGGNHLMIYSDYRNVLKANIKLIEAAPELLANLNGLVEYLDNAFTGMGPDYAKIIDNSKAAIKKATP